MKPIKQSLACGYYLDTTKTILVVSEWNVPWVWEYLQGMGVKAMNGSQYLFLNQKYTITDGFVGDKTKGLG